MGRSFSMQIPAWKMIYNFSYMDHLTLITYNVWFESNYDNRAKKIIQEISDSNPDVVCLQEVLDSRALYTYNLLKQQGYNVCISETERPYRELIATKNLKVLNTDVIPFPKSVMGRELLTVELQTSNGIIFHVGTAHLESIFQFKQERFNQLHTVFKTLEKKIAPGQMGFFLADTKTS